MNMYFILCVFIRCSINVCLKISHQILSLLHSFTEYQYSVQVSEV